MFRTAHNLTALTASALAAFASAAGAADRLSPMGDPPAMTVRYADLNLESPEGVSALYHRLTAAARLVCPSAYSPDLHTQQLSQQCQRTAVDRAVRTIGSPMLARVASDHGISND
jgi:UrcA family protein